MKLEPKGDCLVTRSLAKPRTGWDEAFRKMAERADDAMPDSGDLLENSWDRDEWEW